MSHQPTILVLGATGKVGAETARLLAEFGDVKVVAGVRSPQKAQSLKDKGIEIRHLDLDRQETLTPGLTGIARALCIRLDVTKPAEVQEAVKQALEKFGRIDVLVNNAGYGSMGAIEEVSDEVVRQQYETNVFGALAVTRAVLPQMRQQRSGYIFNLSSVGGMVSFPGAGIYCSTKFALEGISEALAKEVAPLGIKIIIVEDSICGKWQSSLAFTFRR